MRKQPEISKTLLFEKLGYEPHSKLQWKVHNSEARFRIPCCGRRWGKTTFAANELTYAMFIPDTRYWIVGLKYSTGEKEFRIVYNNFVRKLGLGEKLLKKVYNVKQGDMMIETPWHSIVEVVSAERKDSLIGEGLDGAIISEAALQDADTWEMYIEPALSDRRGWAIFPSTPRGYNWYYGLWKLGQDKRFPEYESWRLPTWTNKAIFPGGLNDPEIKRIKEKASVYHFNQEYAAQFTAVAGQIYDEWNPAYHVKNIEYNPNWKNYWVFDYGFSDPFVCLDIMVDPEDNVYVWREYQVRGKSTFEHGRILAERPNPPGFHVDGMYGDPRGADQAATLALTLGPIFSADVPWIHGIEAVKRHLKLQPNGQPKLFVDAGCYELVRQMTMLRPPNPKEGRNAKEGQHDYDDHGPDALRYFMGQHFFLGGRSHLSDIYTAGYLGSEAEGFFTRNSGITREDVPIGF